jgi:hypothetical protein
MMAVSNNDIFYRNSMQDVANVYRSGAADQSEKDAKITLALCDMVDDLLKKFDSKNEAIEHLKDAIRREKR